MDPKEKEIASLPVGIEVKHSPNPVKATVGGRSGNKYTWQVTTTVRSLHGPLTIQEFGGFSWLNGHWVLTNFTGKPFTAVDFADWYSCPKAVLEPSKEYSDPTNWGSNNNLQPSRAKWYFIAINDKGERFKGEAELEELAEVAK